MSESGAFSSFSTEDEDLARWAGRVVERLQAGEAVVLDDEIADQPARADEIRHIFPTLELMVRLIPKSGTGAGVHSGEGGQVGVDLTGSWGDFQAIRPIGRGGMGVVYEAVQLSLNRRVALKILPAVSAADPRRLKRFQVEAQVAALLHHPHIVPVYVVGSEGDVHFFAMQLIEGRTLAELITSCRHRVEAGEERGLSYKSAADFGRQAAEALQFAHEQGILHRDIKPSNLLIEDGGWLWVTDFGLARIPGNSSLTRTGDLLGTVRYMSPEQTLGSHSVIDHRTDVYSLGATLFELLTLQPAFAGDDPLELLTRVHSEEVCPLRRLAPAIPRDLETIISKAMSKSPSDRYATARELAEDLRRFLEDRPIQARRPSMLDLASKWSRRHRAAVLLTTFACLLGLSAISTASHWRTRFLKEHNRHLQEAVTLAEQREREANSQRALASQLERYARRLWYDSQVHVAQQALSIGRAEFAQETLGKLRDGPVKVDSFGFEWDYVWHASQREATLLFGHERPIQRVAISPDGRSLVSGDYFGNLIFWDLADGRPRRRVAGHPSSIDGLVISPSGQVLASLGSDKDGRPLEVKLWDMATGRELIRLPEIRDDVKSVAFSPDSRELAVTFREPAARAEFWDLSRGPASATRKGSPIPSYSLGYSPDGRMLVSTTKGGPLTIRDASDRRVVRTLTGPGFAVETLGYLDDGPTILSGGEHGIFAWTPDSPQGFHVIDLPYVRDLNWSPSWRGAGLGTSRGRWGLASDDKRGAKRHHISKIKTNDGYQNTALSPDGSLLAIGGDGLSPAIWETASWRKVATFERINRVVGSLVFTPDQQSLAIASGASQVYIWHFGAQTPTVRDLAGHDKEVWALAYTPDGSTLISSGDDHSIKLWDARDGRLLKTLVGHESLVEALAVSPDGKSLASAGFDTTVRVWDLPDGKVRAVLKGHTARVRAVAFSPDGKLIASGGRDKTVRLWNAEHGSVVDVLEGHSLDIRALAFSPAGRRLVSSSEDRTIRVWEIANRQEKHVLTSAYHEVAMAFSPDGSSLASATEDGTITIRDATTWSLRTSAKGADTLVFDLCFSPDGKTLASACGDAKVRVWDPITGQVMLVLEGHKQRVNAVAFSPDGRTLASGSHDGAVRLWLSGPP